MCSNGVSALTTPWSKSPRAIGCTFPCKVVTCASSIRAATRLVGTCARADVPHPQRTRKAKREEQNLTCLGIHIPSRRPARKTHSVAEFRRLSSIGLPDRKPGTYSRGLNYLSLRDRKQLRSGRRK